MKPLFFASGLLCPVSTPVLVSTVGKLAYTLGHLLRSFAFLAALFSLVLPLTALVIISPVRSHD